MPYVLGVDIGNSFTTAVAARVDDDRSLPDPHPVRLGEGQNAVPSVAFVEDGGRVLIGNPAVQAGTRQPERVLRDFRQRIGDPVPFSIAGTRVAAEDAYAAVARWVVDRATEREGAPPEHVSLTHPSGWGTYKIGLVRRALAIVGLADADLVSEPEAAFRNHAAKHAPPADHIVAVYDLGGSTFDVTIVTRSSDGEIRRLGETGHLGLGGADFDDRLFRLVAGRSKDGYPIGGAPEGEAMAAFSALRRECVLVKETLSFRFEASLTVGMPGGRTIARLVRQEFEAAIGDSVRSTIDALRRTLESAELTSEDVDSVLLVGGSSQIPLIGRSITEAIGRPTTLDPDASTAFAAGAALAAVAEHTAAERRSTLLAAAQVRDAVAAERAVSEPPTARRLLHPIAALTSLRLRPSPNAAHVAARVVPGAVAAVVVSLILTVVMAQGVGFNALSPQDSTLPAAGASEWLPESLRSDGPSGFPFKTYSEPEPEPEAGAGVVPFFSPPPETRAFMPVRTGSAAPRQSGGEVTAATRPSPPRAASTKPETAPSPSPSPSPTPSPTPSSPPAPVPDPPAPDPEPDPVPVPDPNPDPAPEPEPEPVPDPNPDPEPEPAPGGGE